MTHIFAVILLATDLVGTGIALSEPRDVGPFKAVRLIGGVSATALAVAVLV